ncbi:response regulator [Acidipropionibacterium jensenii]|uniref:response regulator n=1 Tax=Acidipropionibacterium jensenii TaxID=1749 RepID=UPI00214BE459|nr:response regulator [Acidipropionibacterium jensenii]
MTAVRVGICDPDPLIRLGLTTQVNAAPELTLTGQYADGTQALEAAHTHDYDVLLVDLELPDMPAAHLVWHLVTTGATCRVIYVTAFPPAGIDIHAGPGVLAGVITKDTTPTLLAAAITAAHTGLAVATPGLAAILTHAPHPSLAQTPRETAILARTCQGMTYPAIAADLHLSLSTIKRTITTLTTRTGAHNRSELIAMES